MKPTVTAREHYDRLAASGHGRHDPPVLRSYMARWDGPRFFELLSDLAGRDVLEVGIGTGRLARQVLRNGCRRLTGLDLSPQTLAATRADLAEFANLELVAGDITEFRRDAAFDVVYSVLTFMHVEDKPTALRNVVASLRPGGRLVLSLDREADWLDFGEWTVRLWPWRPEQYVAALVQCGCQVAPPAPLLDTWVGPGGRRSDTYGQPVATLIQATKG